ncbi:hypothetical protein G9F73_011320 [Clostridium estertheticum]|uniref:hypothetical protein n=1 Tax=Clostridium estertheticum TaxID=238834 RepID=UPI0013EEA385|nr:hypothetical protein [Clostridium estertheticum]MBZ9608398.1 hypothetical protein [Clostridium estertheticum]
MCKTRKFKGTLAILLMLMAMLSFKLMFVKDKFIAYKKQVVFNVTKNANITKDENDNNVEKYGYSDILECLIENKDFEMKSINMMENEKCNVEVNYNGDIKLLRSSLSALNESENFLGVKSISINKDTNTTNISIDFKKNK